MPVCYLRIRAVRDTIMRIQGIVSIPSNDVLSFTDPHFPGCWIGKNYKPGRIVFEYLWMWIAAFIMLCLYGVIALVIRGILVIGDEQKDERSWKIMWNWQPKQLATLSRKRGDFVGSKNEAEGPDDSEDRRQAKAVANRMLLYVFQTFLVQSKGERLTFSFLVIQQSTYSACSPSQSLGGSRSAATTSLQPPLSRPTSSSLSRASSTRFSTSSLAPTSSKAATPTVVRPWGTSSHWAPGRFDGKRPESKTRTASVATRTARYRSFMALGISLIGAKTISGSRKAAPLAMPMIQHG